MSVRTLFDVNHDFAGYVEEHPEEFVRDLLHYLRSGFQDDAERLRIRYGMTRIGKRHHTEPLWSALPKDERSDPDDVPPFV